MTYLRESGLDRAFIEASVIGTTVAVERENKPKIRVK